MLTFVKLLKVSLFPVPCSLFPLRTIQTLIDFGDFGNPFSALPVFHGHD
ncbi:MAG: hypothetical protein F6J94_16130 [Moorea sp. SIO1F2]|nr:hypothetical protein [Moorena sp. SIO1F2]NEO66240.1 hypothetical protein [Moorena sp. SIO4G2]NET83385.1 hypothetical protein [Moorena sp. SIO1F2]